MEDNREIAEGNTTLVGPYNENLTSPTDEIVKVQQNDQKLDEPEIQQNEIQLSNSSMLMRIGDEMSIKLDSKKGKSELIYYYFFKCFNILYNRRLR